MPNDHTEIKRFFLSDLSDFLVDYQQVGNRYLVRGLPLCRVGEWNAAGGLLELSLDDLNDYASNFAAIKDADGWTPPMRPRHPSDEEDAQGTWDTRNNLGYIQGLRVDEGRGALLADVEVDSDTFGLISGGNLKYISGELGIENSYHSPSLDETFDRVVLGGAFVDNPAVKGMNWSLVLNASDFRPEPPLMTNAQLQAIGNEYANLQMKGGAKMGNFIDSIKALFAAGEVKEEDVVALAAEIEPEEPKQETADWEAAVEAAEAKAADAQAEATKAVAAAEKVTAGAALEAKVARANARVTALSASRHIIPAQEDPLRAVLTALDGQARTVKLADGTEQDEDLADVLVGVIQAKDAVDERWFKQISASAPDEEKATEEKVERMYDSQAPATTG